MSLTSHIISEEYSTEDDNAMSAYYPLGEYPSYALHYISSMFINIHQLKTNLDTQHQHEKHEIIQLNERLRFFVDRVQQLEQQNAKYATKVAEFHRQSFNTSVFDTELDNRHVSLQTNLMTVHYKKLDYQLEFELFQMQGEIYKQLIIIVNQSNDEQRLSLQHELDQSSSTLINVRTSYAELQKKIASLQTERENTFQQYLNVTDDWGHCRKQIGELKFSVEALKNQHLFYKNTCSYIESDSYSVEMFDVKQFWAVKLEKIIANIRHDYELLYASMHRETATYYEKKMEEVRIEVKQTEVQETKYYEEMEIHRLEIIQQTLKTEHEEMQKMYAHEREILLKLEATQSKLESEFESIQIEHSERLEEQSKDLQILQGRVITMVDSIEEMRRRKVGLESELIVYRHLLETDEIQKEVVIGSSALVRSTTTKTYIIESQEKASIGIECPLDSTYICLVNHSIRKDIDISGWKLKRRVDSKAEIKYILPDGISLSAGGELRIYSKLGAVAAEASLDYDTVTSSLRQKLVNKNIASWVIGDRIETRLFDEDGEEKGSCIQTAASEETISDQ